MNSQLLIESIRKNNNMEIIAKDNKISIDELKKILIESIQLNPPRPKKETIPEPKEETIPEPKEETVSEEEYDTDNDEDVYDRIIRKSPIKLTEEQIEFLDLAVKQRKNILLAASAGYGKSASIATAIQLFQHIFKQHSKMYFSKKYGSYSNPDELALCSTYGLCASTGRASSLIKGRTLHSYFGIGIGKGNVDDWVQRVRTAIYLRDTYNNLRAVQVIVIDEVSMISDVLLDKISEYLQKLRKCDKPFGGVQMIFIGDMAQLSPVENDFMFKSTEYKAAKVQTHTLTKCFRQNDPILLNILNEIRLGHCSDESFQILKAQTSIDEEYSQGLKPMRIVATNSEVDVINNRELMEVCKQGGLAPVSFPIKYTDSNTKKADAYRKADMIPEDVKLVVGAQIVVMHNISRSIVNGSQGIVTEIKSNEVIVNLIDIGEVTIGYFGYKDPEHNDIYSAKTLFQYMPLRLGFASTVHRIQGMSLKLIEVDLSKVFCSGQTYTALSRAHSLQGIIVKGLKSKKVFICDPSVKRFLAIK